MWVIVLFMLVLMTSHVIVTKLLSKKDDSEED